MGRVFFEHNEDISNDIFFHLWEKKLCFCLIHLGFLKSRQFILRIQSLAPELRIISRALNITCGFLCIILKIITLKITAFLSSCNFELGYKIGSWIQRLLLIVLCLFFQTPHVFWLHQLCNLFFSLLRKYFSQRFSTVLFMRCREC